MGCTSSSQPVPVPPQTEGKKTAELPNLMNTPKVSVDGGYSEVGRRTRRTRRTAFEAMVDEDQDLAQLKGEDAAIALMQVAQEADELDQEMKPMIALVSHDNMKPLMASFAKCYSEILSKFRLTGTGTTCKVLRTIGLEPEDMNVPSGPLGGDQVLGAMICDGTISALFFFQDPLSSHAHAADIGALSRLCNVYQIYFATNYRSAGAILDYLDNKRLASVRVPEGMNRDLGELVQEKYKQTRQLAVAAAI